ncbi:MAG: ABC transporter permease [Bacteroidota bacterium]
MFKHNLLIAYRSFIRNKGSFLINILGLTTGLACALFIGLWVQNELEIDSYHEKKDRLYQVMQQIPMVDGVMVADWTPGPLAQALMDELPEVERAISAKMAPDVFDGIISFDESFIKARPQYADQGFFDLFSYPLLHGDKQQVLGSPYDVVISADLAEKLFGTTSRAMGQTVKWEKKIGEIIDFSRDFTVTGVFDNEPARTSTNFDLLFSFDFYLEKSPQTAEWFNDQASTYVLLKPGMNTSELDEKITSLVGARRNAKHGFFLQSYASRYLYNNYDKGAVAGGRIEYLWLFSIIAVLMLMIAGVNFMNLATAKASIRVKEIGTKKTIGATRGQLMGQFVQESMLIALLAFGCAILVVYLLLPQFNMITGKALTLDTSLGLWAIMLGVALLTGLLSSVYPALYLSGFNPIQVLKGKMQISFGEVWLRKALVVFQFAVSAVLIVFVTVIFLQMEFIQTKNLGYDRDNVIAIQREGALENDVETFLAEVKALPGVQHASNSSSKLIESSNFTWGIDWPGRQPDEQLQINPFIVSYGYLETFDINLVRGRSFDQTHGNEYNKVILNEAAVASMGLENPLGTVLTIWNEDVEVVGVAEDFHFQSMYKDIAPCFFKLFPEGNNYGAEINIKISAGAEVATLAQIEKLYTIHNPGYPFAFSFVDDEYQAIYESEARTSVLSRLFAALAILISCLGLFGLAAFTAERRTKEIGIRKVLGASAWGIVGLLSKDFTRMILIAILVALPVSYFIVAHWLEAFMYSIELQWWIFAGAALITLGTAWVTVGFQTFRASTINPVTCLQYE